MVKASMVALSGLLGMAASAGAQAHTVSGLAGATLVMGGGGGAVAQQIGPTGATAARVGGKGASGGVLSFSTAEAAGMVRSQQRPTVVILYGQSCPISQAMFPGFVALAEHYTQRGVTFLAFSTGGPAAGVPQFLGRYQAPFQPLHIKRWPAGALARDMADVGLHMGAAWTQPYVAVLDRSGRVVGEWDAARDLRAIDAALQTVQ